MSDDTDLKKLKAARRALWATGGAKLLGTGAIVSGGLLAIPLAIGALFYVAVAADAAEEAFKDN